MTIYPIRLDTFIPTSSLGYKDPFQFVPGFRWDYMEWMAEDGQNTLATIPCNFDPDLRRLHDTYFQSGIGDGEDLEFRGFETLLADVISLNVKDFSCNTGLPGNTILSSLWMPKVNRGDYFVNKLHGYLYPDNAIMLSSIDSFVKDGVTFSMAYLPFEGKYGIPISVIQFGYEDDDIVPLTYFRQVQKFSGRTENGYMMDTTNDLLAIDTDQREFVVTHYVDWRVKEDLEAETVGPEYNFVLEYTPVSPYIVEFTRSDIFRTEITWIEWQARKIAGTLESGDYYVGYYGSECPPGLVEVYLPVAEFIPDDFGRISYTKEYPIQVTLNSYYLDSYEEEVGLSNTNQFQIFHVNFVPLLDMSSPDHLDAANTIVHVGTEIWDRVDNIFERNQAGVYIHAWDEKIYDLDIEHGQIRFGGGDNSIEHMAYPGLIPPMGASIKVNYSSYPVIQYAPVGQLETYSDPDLNLNPAFNIITRGFLYLSGRRLIPAKLELETYTPFNDEIGYYGPVTIGSQNLILKAKVLTSKNEIVPNTVVRFVDNPEVGSFASHYAVSNSDGYAYNRYDLGMTLDKMSMHVDFYEPANWNSWGWAGQDISGIATDHILDRRNTNPPATQLIASTPAFVPAYVDGNKLYIPGVGEGLTNTPVDEVLIFLVYNDNSINPYEVDGRDGGRWNVLAGREYPGGPINPLHPVTMIAHTGYVELDFDQAITLPSPDLTVLWEGNIYVSPDGRRILIPVPGYSTPADTWSVELRGLISLFLYGGDYFPRIKKATAEGEVIILDRDIPIQELDLSGYTNWPYTLHAKFHRLNYHLVQYRIFSSTILNMFAELPCLDKIIKSNILQFDVILPPQYIGTFILDPGQPGSALSGANYLVLNEIQLDQVVPNENISENDILTLIGMNFPTDRAVPVWVDNVRVNPDNVTVIDSTEIQVKAPAHAIGNAVISIGVPLADKGRKLIRYGEAFPIFSPTPSWRGPGIL